MRHLFLPFFCTREDLVFLQVQRKKISE